MLISRYFCNSFTVVCQVVLVIGDQNTGHLCYAYKVRYFECCKKKKNFLAHCVAKRIKNANRYAIGIIQMPRTI